MTLLRSKFLRRFFLAHLQSQVGTGAAYVALVLVAYERLRSGWAIALVLLADFLPVIFLSAPFGALADRLSRTRLAVVAELLRAGAFVALAVVPSFAATVGLALAAGIGTALFRPAVNAALPGLVDAHRRAAATAIYVAIANLGLMVGPALTGLLLLFTSPATVLAANGVTFLISAALISGVPLGRAAERVSEKRKSDGGTRSALRTIRATPGIWPLLVIGAFSVLAGAMINVAEPLLAVRTLHAGNSGYSLLVTVCGCGMVAGSLVGARGCPGVESLRLRWLLGLASCGLAMVASAGSPGLDWAVVAFGAIGFSNALIMGPEMRLFQELASEWLMGRVFGLRDVLGNVAFVVAFLATGALLSLLGTRIVFAFAGCGLVSMALAGALVFHPQREREAEASLAHIRA